MNDIKTEIENSNIGDNVISFKDNYIFIVANGEQTSEMAEEYYRMFRKLISQSDEKINLVIDLNSAGKNDPGARDIWRKLTRRGSNKQTT